MKSFMKRFVSCRRGDSWKTKICSLVAILLVFASDWAVGAPSSALIDSINDFEAMGPVFEFDSLTIHWQGSQWAHSKGRLQWLTIVDGKPTGALICSMGRFSFAPRLMPEKDILKRVLKVEKVETPYDGLLLRFTPEVGERLSAEFNLRESGERISCKYLMADAQDEWNRMDNTAIAPKIARAFIQSLSPPILYARIVTNKLGELIYFYDGQDPEPVKLLNPADLRNDLQMLSSFHPESRSVADIPAYHDSADVEISKYEMTVIIGEQGGMHIRGTLWFKPMRPEATFISLQLHPKMEILSFSDEKGIPVEVWRKRHSGEWDDELYLISPQAPSPESERHWNFEIQGKALDRSYGQFFLDPRLDWFPTSGYLRYADFDVTFEYPRYYDLVAHGKKVEETEEKGIKRAHWITEKKVAGMPFSVGEMRQTQVEKEGLPTITLCQTDVASPEIKHYLQSQGISIGGNMGREVSDEVSSALQFYTSLFGPCSAEHIYVTEILGGHGQGFLGFIQLSWLTFTLSDDWGVNRSFRAHEVAHEWWGEDIRWDSYHDQWLSEGFAEYSAWWYLQLAMGNKLFFKRLEKAQDDILNSRNYLLEKGPTTGSLWLGWRASTSETEGDYFRLTYEKGAWILHMLRNLLIDFKTMNEDKLKAVLREFYRRYQGRNADTEDFRKTLEELTGESYQWFFDQWIYGADIPTYSWNYTKEKEGDFWKVVLRVRQEGVSDEFQMPVPVSVEFKNGKRATVRLNIRGDQELYELPRIAEEPKNILFNDYHSVLCEADRK
jgi:hypothetical protein